MRISDWVILYKCASHLIASSLFKHPRVIPHKEGRGFSSIVVLSDNCDEVSITLIFITPSHQYQVKWRVKSSESVEEDN